MRSADGMGTVTARGKARVWRPGMLESEFFKIDFIFVELLMKFKSQISILHTNDRITHLVDINLSAEVIQLNFLAKDLMAKSAQTFNFRCNIDQVFLGPSS